MQLRYSLPLVPPLCTERQIRCANPCILCRLSTKAYQPLYRIPFLFCCLSARHVGTQQAISLPFCRLGTSQVISACFSSRFLSQCKAYKVQYAYRLCHVPSRRKAYSYDHMKSSIRSLFAVSVQADPVRPICHSYCVLPSHQLRRVVPT
jgi:hypothetical protein